MIVVRAWRELNRYLCPHRDLSFYLADRTRCDGDNGGRFNGARWELWPGVELSRSYGTEMTRIIVTASRPFVWRSLQGVVF